MSIVSSSYPFEPTAPLIIAPEVNAGRRAFPTSQFLLAGGPAADAVTIETGWHDTSINAEAGAFAVVQTGAGHDDLIGKTVQVIAPTGLSVYVFVLQSAGVPSPLSLARRAWMALTRPSVETLECSVQVVTPS